MTSIDTNINNYTLPELLTILEIDEPTRESIEEKTQEYIDKYTVEKNTNLTTFFQNMQDVLLNYMDDLENDEDAEFAPAKKQTDAWIKNEVLEQPNPVQNDKITDRKQQIDVYDNNHVPMNQKQLGVNNNFVVGVAQDTLNPNLKNSITQIINLDSQFRQTTGIEDSSTDYTVDLSDPLTNVLSMKLYAYSIPYTWYAIDKSYGNTCFWINDLTFQNGIYVPISIEPGNYTQEKNSGVTIASFSATSDVTDFISTIYAAMVGVGFDFSSSSSTCAFSTTNSTAVVYYNTNNAKITLNLYGATFPSSSVKISELTVVTFFDFTGQLNCNLDSDSVGCISTGSYVNQTLGWIMGYRLPYISILTKGNPAPAVLDLNGSRYLILVIDDYNQNHINNGLVSITELSKTLKMPTYYSPDLPYTCTRATSNLTSLYTDISSQNAQNPGGSLDLYAGDLIAEKITSSFKKNPQLLPSAPRTLTQSQIYTINEIIKNNEQNTNFRLKAPTSTDIFAIIPLKGGFKTGEMITELSGSLGENKRVYFGPVNIDRMRIRLLDDKGNVLNLHGSEWCVTIISENLYQY